jgi:hypothetical protein
VFGKHNTEILAMGEPGRGGGLASTVGAIVGALAVLAAVLAFIHASGGLTQHVRTIELPPAQRAAAERTAAVESAPPQAPG